MYSKVKSMGHPLHLMLVNFPLGLWVTAVVFDIIHLITSNGYWSGLAFWMIAAGAICGLLSAMPGAIDWTGSSASMIEILLLQALAHQALDQTPQAIFQLIQALQLAEARGYTRLFLDEGPFLVALLHQAAARQIAPGYVRALLAQFPDMVAPSSVQERTGLPLLRESLSEREREVLRSVSAGLSNQETAAHLTITAGAVKKHLSNIYRKLGVSSRTQALARARELDLL